LYSVLLLSYSFEAGSINESGSILIATNYVAATTYKLHIHTLHTIDTTYKHTHTSHTPHTHHIHIHCTTHIHTHTTLNNTHTHT
jgi:hypothetical protein